MSKRKNAQTSLQACFIVAFSLLLTACGASAVHVIPTEPPTATVTLTVTASRTPGLFVTPTHTETPAPMTPTGGPSPTGIFGATSTPSADDPTPTQSLNPNAPRIEFFTADVLAVAPGASLTLFWSTRNTATATIYRLDTNGERNQLWNVPPDGSLPVSTRQSDRGNVRFVLSVGEGASSMETVLTLPLSCPDDWFFLPRPDECPAGPAVETQMLEANFERGRMFYIAENNRVYALFNDGASPAWISFENRYNPEFHPEFEESFVPPPGLYQPVGILGFAWRGRDLVRNRLGLALSPHADYLGSVQRVLTNSGDESLFASSANGTVTQLLPGGTSWQIIAPS